MVSKMCKNVVTSSALSSANLLRWSNGWSILTSSLKKLYVWANPLMSFITLFLAWDNWSSFVFFLTYSILSTFFYQIIRLTDFTNIVFGEFCLDVFAKTFRYIIIFDQKLGWNGIYLFWWSFLACSSVSWHSFLVNMALQLSHITCTEYFLETLSLARTAWLSLPSFSMLFKWIPYMP